MKILNEDFFDTDIDNELPDEELNNEVDDTSENIPEPTYSIVLSPDLKLFDKCFKYVNTLLNAYKEGIFDYCDITKSTDSSFIVIVFHFKSNYNVRSYYSFIKYLINYDYLNLKFGRYSSDETSKLSHKDIHYLLSGSKTRRNEIDIYACFYVFGLQDDYYNVIGTKRLIRELEQRASFFFSGDMDDEMLKKVMDSNSDCRMQAYVTILNITHEQIFTNPYIKLDNNLPVTFNGDNDILVGNWYDGCEPESLKDALSSPVIKYIRAQNERYEYIWEWHTKPAMLIYNETYAEKSRDNSVPCFIVNTYKKPVERETDDFEWNMKFGVVNYNLTACIRMMNVLFSKDFGCVSNYTVTINESKIYSSYYIINIDYNLIDDVNENDFYKFAKNIVRYYATNCNNAKCDVIIKNKKHYDLPALVITTNPNYLKMQNIMIMSIFYAHNMMNKFRKLSGGLRILPEINDEVEIIDLENNDRKTFLKNIRSGEDAYNNTLFVSFFSTISSGRNYFIEDDYKNIVTIGLVRYFLKPDIISKYLYHGLVSDNFEVPSAVTIADAEKSKSIVAERFKNRKTTYNWRIFSKIIYLQSKIKDLKIPAIVIESFTEH